MGRHKMVAIIVVGGRGGVLGINRYVTFIPIYEIELFINLDEPILPGTYQMHIFRGAWVAQSVKPLTSAPVMISQLVSSSPALGSGLTARSSEPGACFDFCVSLSLSTPPLPQLCALSLALSLSLKNKHLKN